MSGCTYSATTAPVAKVPNPQPAIVGVWFEDLQLSRMKTLGIFILDREAGGHACTTELLANSPIVGTFRSAREAWKMSDDHAASGSPVIWYRARYNDSLTFEQASPPHRDKYETEDCAQIPIGAPDSGLTPRATVFLLPPPLQERGVAVILRPEGHGRSLLDLWPEDISTSMTTSWQDFDQRITPIHPTEYFVYAAGRPALGNEPGFADWRARKGHPAPDQP
jgi:hypothetical protein